MSLVTGARSKLYINFRFIGEVTDFEWSSSTQKKPIYGIDATEPFEFSPGITKVRGAFSLLRPQAAGSLEGYGITTSFEEHTKEKYVNIVLMDRKVPLPLFQCERAVILSQSWRVPSRGIMTGSVEFEGFVWNNEVGFLLGKTH
jgi:hypothetical protein